MNEYTLKDKFILGSGLLATIAAALLLPGNW